MELHGTERDRDIWVLGAISTTTVIVVVVVVVISLPKNKKRSPQSPTSSLLAQANFLPTGVSLGLIA